MNKATDMIKTNIVPGKTARVSVTVCDSNTAAAMKSGLLPVFATPSLVALMEQAACECLADCLEDGQTSVGTGINISHTAASPRGAEITAEATVDAVDGRTVTFAVTANDKFGEIGNGRHTRVIISTEKFMSKAEARM